MTVPSPFSYCTHHLLIFSQYACSIHHCLRSHHVRNADTVSILVCFVTVAHFFDFLWYFRLICNDFVMTRQLYFVLPILHCAYATLQFQPTAITVHLFFLNWRRGSQSRSCNHTSQGDHSDFILQLASKCPF